MVFREEECEKSLFVGLIEYKRYSFSCLFGYLLVELATTTRSIRGTGKTIKEEEKISWSIDTQVNTYTDNATSNLYTIVYINIAII